MNIKIIGAVCVVAGCAACGFIMASQHMIKIRQMRNLIRALDFMVCELQYHCTPLPQLCRMAGTQNRGEVGQVLYLLADELESQICPNAGRCLSAVLDKQYGIDCLTKEMLFLVGENLGRFDLSGQVRGLENTKDQCSEKLAELLKNKESRIRSYQTLGLCAGAAVAILFV